MVKLSQRLAAIASLAENSKSVVDVGTDHGHIPVWLAELGCAEKITASDIRKGPLESAVMFARENDVYDRINFVLTDGLNGLDSDYDTVIIAGMGGETIISILEAAPWTKNGTKLILQPQSKTELLSKWLYDNGYSVNDGKIVLDAGKVYVVLSVSAGEADAPEGIYLHIDRCLIDKKEPNLIHYIDNLLYKNKKYIEGMEKGGLTESAEWKAAKSFENDLSALKKETEKW